MIPALLLTFCLCACNSDFSEQKNSVTNSDTENKSKNSTEFYSISSNIKLLCAWQREDYIHQGYIASHYLIYYVTDENQAYSAFWETNETTPDNAILHMDDFTNTEELGKISFDPDHLLSEVSTQELTIETESEQLDIDEPNIWFYGYNSSQDVTNQFLFYQSGNITEKRIQTGEGTELVNQLYSESTFEDARFKWSAFYMNLGESVSE